MTLEPGTIYAKIHDVPGEYDPDTGTQMEAAVEIEFDIAFANGDIKCVNTYVPPSYTNSQIRQVVADTAHNLCVSLGIDDLEVTITEFRHTAKPIEPALETAL